MMEKVRRELIAVVNLLGAFQVTGAIFVFAVWLTMVCIAMAVTMTPLQIVVTIGVIGVLGKCFCALYCWLKRLAARHEQDGVS